MVTATRKIFESTEKQSKYRLFELFSVRTLIYSFLVFLIASYLHITQTTFSELPIAYIVLLITVFYSSLFFLIDLFKKRVMKICFENELVTFYYKTMLANNVSTWRLTSTEICFFELKNAKDYFIGFQIDFKNNNDSSKLKLLDLDWSYIDFENIYLEFKERKNEKIPENEKKFFKDLQFFNNTGDKNII